jgi:amidase
VSGQHLDATETAAMIRRREITALEAVEEAIARAQELQPKLNFLVTDTFDRARERASSGSLEGPFAGVPYLVKDMYDVRGVPTRWGAKFSESVGPAAKNCPQVDAFEAAGLVVIGKSAMSEIGWLPTTEPLAFGPTRSPWNLERTPGGSSGGSAAAVAAGILPMADAADGGGSIRIPASASGLFGLKPSRGRLIGRQDAAGDLVLTAEHCLSRSVRDSAGLFAAMEESLLPVELPRVGFVKGPAKRRLHVGYLLADLNGSQPEAEVRAGAEAAAALLQRLGHTVEPTAWPFPGARAFEDFSLLFASAAQHVVELARLAINPKPLSLASIVLQKLGLLHGGLGKMPDTSVLEPLTFGMAARAASLAPGEVESAVARLEAAALTYDRWFETFDVILSPVLRTPPVPIGHITGDVPLETLLERIADFALYTEVHNAFGVPAMSVPLHWTADGLPVGIQFAARMGQERALFELAYELEEAAPWAGRRPPVYASGRSLTPA